MNYNIPLFQFPLFLGLSQAETMQLAGKAHFSFQKVEGPEVLAREGEPCRRLTFLTTGRLTVSTSSDDGAYTMTEYLQAPLMFQAEALFGPSQRYTHTYTAASPCQMVTLEKDELLLLLDSFLIVRLNLLGLLSSTLQRSAHAPWRSVPATLEGRMVRFFIDRSTYPAGRKTVRILMTRLAAELGCSRLEVSEVLRSLERRSLVELHRGRIEIHSLERLLMA